MQIFKFQAFSLYANPLPVPTLMAGMPKLALKVNYLVSLGRVVSPCYSAQALSLHIKSQFEKRKKPWVGCDSLK